MSLHQSNNEKKQTRKQPTIPPSPRFKPAYDQVTEANHMEQPAAGETHLREPSHTVNPTWQKDDTKRSAKVPEPDGLLTHHLGSP